MSTFIDFNGKPVIVSGATSGIGEAIAVTLSRCNAAVILIGRNAEKLSQTAQRLSSQNVKTILLDLEDIGTINSKIRKLAKDTGPIYGLCHAAGIVETRPLSSFKHATFQSMININLTSGIELVKAVCRRDVMMSEGGAVVLISSIYGHVGMPGQIGYSATKGALHAAARAMAIELARRSIRINTLSPGMVMTPMVEMAMSKLSADRVKQLKESHPLGTGKPEDVARAAAFLLAPENKWITGTDLVVDGGYTAR